MNLPHVTRTSSSRMSRAACSARCHRLNRKSIKALGKVPTELNKRLTTLAAVSLAVVMIGTLGATAQAQQVYCANGSCNINTKTYRDGSGWVEESTGMVDGGTALRVTAASGSVQVRGTNDAKVTFTIKKRAVRASSEEN